MAARDPGVNAPLATSVRRVPRRGAGLAAATLCLLALLAGAAAHSAGVVHHHPSAVAAASGADTQAGGPRSAPDVVPPAGTAADPGRGTVREIAADAPSPASTPAHPVRTRGPPATAG